MCFGCFCFLFFCSFFLIYEMYGFFDCGDFCVRWYYDWCYLCIVVVGVCFGVFCYVGDFYFLG